MENYICRTCGVEYAESEAPPSRCIICEDERQYIGWGGQQWTTLAEMKNQGYGNEIKEEEGITGISTAPAFAIGQRALLVQTGEGNVLYDCITYLDDETIEAVKSMGGIQAMCVSHPHFYDTMVTWSHAFDNAPIYIPEADKQWVTRPDPVIKFWDGKPLELLPGATLIQCGGHFPGSAILHWANGADGRGAICVGDSLTVVMDRRFVSFMTSFPNLIPLSADEVQAIVDALEPFDYDRIYGGWWGRNVLTSGKGSCPRLRRAVHQAYQKLEMHVFVDYKGDRIRLTEERLEHIFSSHPEIEGKIDAINETLSSPDHILPSKSDPEVELYVREYYDNNKWVVVVVAVKVNDAFILTAYITSNIPLGDLT